MASMTTSPPFITPLPAAIRAPARDGAHRATARMAGTAAQPWTIRVANRQHGMRASENYELKIRF
jgi:hypothetical protein